LIALCCWSCPCQRCCCCHHCCRHRHCRRCRCCHVLGGCSHLTSWLSFCGHRRGGGIVVQILQFGGIFARPDPCIQGDLTFCEVTALSKSMTIGNALAPWPIRPMPVVVGLVRVPPNFLQLRMHLIFFGNALAPWPMRPTMVMIGLVQVLPNFLQLWMNLIFFCSTTSIMLWGSSVMALIFSVFKYPAAIASMKALKFLLVALVSFMAQRFACQLLLGICLLTFGMLLSMN
jgi:hypothetical protein